MQCHLNLAGHIVFPFKLRKGCVYKLLLFAVHVVNLDQLGIILHYLDHPGVPFSVHPVFI